MGAAFAFEHRAGAIDQDDATGLVQLTCGNHLFLLLPIGGSELDGFMKQPDEIGGAETQSCYLTVADIQAHHDRSHAAGAEVISPLKSFDGSGIGYTCRDPEGHIWSFGSYDPWSEREALPANASRMTRSMAAAKSLSPSALAAGLACVAILAGFGGAGVSRLTYSSAEEARLRADVTAARADVKAALKKAEATKGHADQATELAHRRDAELTRERSTREALGRDLQRSLVRANRERSAREAAEQTLRQRETESAEERRARATAERAAGMANEATARERSQREAAERSNAELRKDLAVAKTAKAKADRTAESTADKLANERLARERAERLARELGDKLKQTANAAAAATADPGGKSDPRPPAPVPAKKPSAPAASSLSTPAAGQQPQPSVAP